MNLRVQKIEDKVLELEEKKRKLEVKLVQEKAKLREQQRKARTRQLIEIGSLAEQAGILDVDKSALLAGFFQLAELCRDEPTFKALKQQGETIFKK